MRSTARDVAAALAPVVVAALTGCPPPETIDVTAPRVVSVEPAEAVVPVTQAFTLTFSEDLDEETVDADPLSETLSVAVVPRALLTDAFRSDLDNPPVSESRVDDLISIDAAVRGETLTVTPRAPLAARTAFVLFVSSEVRDVVGNPLAGEGGKKGPFVYEFTTDAGQPAVDATDAVSSSAPVVVPNRRRIHVAFNQPVTNVSVDTLRVEGTGGAAAPNVEAILVDADRTRATILLGALAGGCERLSPASTYAIVASEAIVGDSGQALAAYREEFPTGGACDATANTIAAAVDAIAGETSATVRFSTSKASTTEVRFGLAGAALDCLGGPCPVVGVDARTPVAGSSPPRFLHSVELAGLSLDVEYAFVVSAEDDVGSVATRAGTFLTAPLPKVSINEVMANPPAGAAEPGDEYVELVNFGELPIDLSGYLFEIDGGDANGGDTCALPTPGPTLAAGGFLVLVGDAFNGTVYGGVDAGLLLASTKSSFCATLTNSEAQALVLKDSTGRPVSSFTAYTDLMPTRDGRSIERTAPDASDVAASYCFSRTDTGPTPGRQNGVVAAGCE